MPVPPRVPAEPSVPPGILDRPVCTSRERASPADLPSLSFPAHRGQDPDAAKGGPARVKNQHGIGLPVRHHAGRRYPANPMLGPLPCRNRRRIIHADGAIRLDDPPSSCGCLPLQGIAGQRFSSIALPHVTPEVLFAFGALTRSGSARPCSPARPMCVEDGHSRIRAADPLDTPGLQGER